MDGAKYPDGTCRVFAGHDSAGHSFPLCSVARNVRNRHREGERVACGLFGFSAQPPADAQIARVIRRVPPGVGIADRIDAGDLSITFERRK